MQDSDVSPSPVLTSATPSAASPGTRRSAASARSEQRIQSILKVAREVFAEKGYERATTGEMAQRLGISEATVFTYFRGKRELCVRVINDWYDEIIAVVEQGMPREAPVREQLRFFIATHLRLFLQQGTGLCALVLSEGRAKGQDLGESFLPLQRRYTAPLMDVLARGQASGDIRADVPLRLLRALILGPMEHLLWEAVGLQRQIDIERSAEALVSLLWNSVRNECEELHALRAFRNEVMSALRRSGAST
jgi:AcrR family transcriptional regulator